MTALFVAMWLAAQSPAPTFDQIRADANLEHRARIAIDYAAAWERTAEDAYGRGDLKGAGDSLKQMLAGVELAEQSLTATGKSPRRHPGPFKAAELKTLDILRRLGDLERRMDDDDRALVAIPRARIQEIHDSWFDGIMSNRK